MADPLSQLRQYHISGKEIITRGDYICFGDGYCWPKTTKTNWREFRLVLVSKYQLVLDSKNQLVLEYLNQRIN